MRGCETDRQTELERGGEIEREGELNWKIETFTKERRERGEVNNVHYDTIAFKK